MICWVWPCCPCTCTACPPWIWIWPGWTNWICGRKSQKGTLTMPLISPSSASAWPSHLWGWFTVAQKKKAASLLFFQLKMRSFKGLLPVTQQPSHAGQEGPVGCVTVLQQLCAAYTINHSGEINYSHGAGNKQSGGRRGGLRLKTSVGC